MKSRNRFVRRFGEPYSCSVGSFLLLAPSTFLSTESVPTDYACVRALIESRREFLRRPMFEEEVERLVFESLFPSFFVFERPHKKSGVTEVTPLSRLLAVHVKLASARQSANRALNEPATGFHR